MIMRTRYCRPCLVADHYAAKSAFTHSPSHKTHSQSLPSSFNGMKAGRGNICKRKRREKSEGAWWEGEEGQAPSRKPCVELGGDSVSSSDWWLVHRREMTHTFSTSAFVTLMSASIFSKYCCALSASLQSLSNLLLH